MPNAPCNPFTRLMALLKRRPRKTGLKEFVSAPNAYQITATNARWCAGHTCGLKNTKTVNEAHQTPGGFRPGVPNHRLSLDRSLCQQSPVLKPIGRRYFNSVPSVRPFFLCWDGIPAAREKRVVSITISDANGMLKQVNPKNRGTGCTDRWRDKTQKIDIARGKKRKRFPSFP